ncbi:Hypothetical protein GL50581_2239 [Giardia duodenalis ATCC 50581]|nr:Hypothetical protein GL50581_2239 [Giardia intestinalis ATCC 50581]
MTLYYEPENQPGSELVKKDSLFWTATEQFLELIDCEANTEPAVMKLLSRAGFADIAPPASVDPRVIVVDGPIGAGKSTFCRKLAEYAREQALQVAVVEEAVALESFSAYGITLEEYYRDPHANAYRFQLAVTQALADQLMEYRYTDKYKDCDLVIFDRWLPSTSAFILFQMEEGHITPRQGMYLHYLIDVFMSFAGVLPGTHIRFATDPLVCEQRIIDRAAGDSHRQCEEDALMTVRRTNEHLLEQRGIYTPLFNLSYRNEDMVCLSITEGNQFALGQASRATRQYVVQDTHYLGEDQRYFVQINNRKVNSRRFFDELCDWAIYWRRRRGPLHMTKLAKSFEDFERALALAAECKDTSDE